MQTLASRAEKLLAWEQIDLVNDVYRIIDPRWIFQAPCFDGWVDCSGSDRLNDEIKTALDMLGCEYSGIWLGMSVVKSDVCHSVAWKV